MNRQKSIYFLKPVGMSGPIKIGCSRFAKDRILEISRQSPIALEIVCTIPGDGKTEHALHRLFASCHSHLEWFHASPELLEFIDRLNGGVALSEIVDVAEIKGPHPQFSRCGKRRPKLEVAA